MSNPADTWGTVPVEVLGNTIYYMKHETGQLSDEGQDYMRPDGVVDAETLANERTISLRAIALGIQALVLQGEREWAAFNE